MYNTFLHCVFFNVSSCPHLPQQLSKFEWNVCIIQAVDLFYGCSARLPARFTAPANPQPSPNLGCTFIIIRWQQARKLGRCDSYLRNYQWLTDSLTGVSAGRCYRILKNKIITSVFVVVLGEVVAAGSYFTLGGVPCHMLVSGLISSRQCGKQWFSNATMVTMTRSNVCKL